eukprot:6212938-Pleurochrysis_carterae.AAC.3
MFAGKRPDGDWDASRAAPIPQRVPRDTLPCHVPLGIIQVHKRDMKFVLSDSPLPNELPDFGIQQSNAKAEGVELSLRVLTADNGLVANAHIHPAYTLVPCWRWAIRIDVSAHTGYHEGQGIECWGHQKVQGEQGLGCSEEKQESE